VRISLVLGWDGLATALEPAPQAVKLVGRADESEPDRCRSPLDPQSGGAVCCDPESRVDMTRAAAELKRRLIENFGVHYLPRFLRVIGVGAWPR
jgi:hypothetical protein